MQNKTKYSIKNTLHTVTNLKASYAQQKETLTPKSSKPYNSFGNIRAHVTLEPHGSFSDLC